MQFTILQTKSMMQRILSLKKPVLKAKTILPVLTFLSKMLVKTFKTFKITFNTTGLSDFQKMVITVLKSSFAKINTKLIAYRDCK